MFYWSIDIKIYLLQYICIYYIYRYKTILDIQIIRQLSTGRICSIYMASIVLNNSVHRLRFPIGFNNTVVFQKPYRALSQLSDQFSTVLDRFYKYSELKSIHIEISRLNNVNVDQYQTLYNYTLYIVLFIQATFHLGYTSNTLQI